MNALPVGGEHLGDALFRQRYFEDMAKWAFDVAYAAYYAQPIEEIVGPLRPGYIAFAEDAHKRGHPACVQIQSTVAHPSVLDLTEAQYELDNIPVVLGNGSFFASFASEKWKEFLRNLTSIFIRDFGYDWVVYEEPMSKVDIPGSSDRLHTLFVERFPDLEYPASQSEDTAYLKLQRLKADTLTQFYADLVKEAKSMGTERVGIMPWFFIPTIENTPPQTLNTSCDIGRIAAIEGLDFLVARMQPDNIYVDVMRTGDDMQRSPLLHHPEVLAHACGKPVMAVTNPVDEHTNYPELPLIPVEFFKKGLLASMAAAPTGFTRHWYGQRYGEDTEHMDFMSRVNAYVNRLGSPTSPIGFVVSQRGLSHAEPHTYETAWSHYWALAKRLLFEEKLPFRTIYAEALVSNLEADPNLRVVILDEHSPLSVGQERILKQWWNAAPGRAIVVFGAGAGYSADENSPGVQPLSSSFPEILRTIGVRQESSKQITSAGGNAALKRVSRVMRTAFLGDEVEIAAPKVAAVERIFGSHGSILYVEQATESPVIVHYSVGETMGLFCGIELSDATAPVAAKAIRYVLDRVTVEPPAVKSEARGLLWNITSTGYVIVVNTSDVAAEYTLSHHNHLVWDVVNQTLLPDSTVSSLSLGPDSFNLYKRVGKRSKLFDMTGAIYVTSSVDGAGRADIAAYTDGNVSFILRALPKEIRVDGRFWQFSVIQLPEAVQIKLGELTTGDHLFTIRW